MDYQIFSSSMKQFHDCGLKFRQVYFHLHGEPLLNRNINEMVQLVCIYELSERLAMTTNGTLLSKNALIKLVGAGLNEITVSLDSMTRDSYSKFKGRDYFERVKESISQAISLIESGLKLELIIKCTHAHGDKHQMISHEESAILDYYKKFAEFSKKFI